MYIHAEDATVNGTDQPQELQDNDLTAVIRLGTDFVSNYYEIRIPLTLTKFQTALQPDTDEYNDTYGTRTTRLDLDLLTYKDQASKEYFLKISQKCLASYNLTVKRIR